jgi:hypothetical protein
MQQIKLGKDLKGLSLKELRNPSEQKNIYVEVPLCNEGTDLEIHAIKPLTQREARGRHVDAEILKALGHERKFMALCVCSFADTKNNSEIMRRIMCGARVGKPA